MIASNRTFESVNFFMISWPFLPEIHSFVWISPYAVIGPPWSGPTTAAAITTIIRYLTSEMSIHFIPLSLIIHNPRFYIHNNIFQICIYHQTFNRNKITKFHRRFSSFWIVIVITIITKRHPPFDQPESSKDEEKGSSRFLRPFLDFNNKYISVFTILPDLLTMELEMDKRKKNNWFMVRKKRILL